MSGTITFDDKPLTDAMVSFMPMESTPGQGASGFTDGTGKYTVDSLWPGGRVKPGAIPGKYAVRINRYVKPDGTTWKPDPNSDVGPMNSGARDEMPQDYGLMSKLTVEVTKDKKDGYDFTLENKK